MSRFCIAPLVAALSLVSPLPVAAAGEEAPVAVAQAPATTAPAAETGLGAWPIAPSARPFDRALSPEDVQSAPPQAVPVRPDLVAVLGLCRTRLWHR